MNILNWLCCRQKPKEQLKKPLIAVAKQPTSKNFSEDQFSSLPFQLGDKYKGEERNGVPNGNGEMMYKNGDYYRGEWVSGQKEGRGLQIYNQKGYRYEGEWKGNLPNGQGKITQWDGSYYIGEFKDSIKHGKGEFYDFQNKRAVQQIYQNGTLIKQKVKEGALSKDEQFPTLVLDKERFNSEDLQNFQKQNPQIKELEVTFLVKYYDICKIIKLSFIKKHIKEWDDKEVRQFLETVNLSKYKEVFYKNKILGKSLITINESQMKQDLRMKLGDRRRLANYCRYLSEIYNEEKKKKEYRKGNSLKRITPQRKAQQLALSDGGYKSSKFKTAYIDEGDIIQEQNQLDESNEIFDHINSKEKEDDRNMGQNEYNNYQTEEWMQYHSNQVHSMNQAVFDKYQEFGNIPKSQKSSSSKSHGSMTGSVVKNISTRKKSKEEQDEELFLTNSYPQKMKIMNSQHVIPIPDNERQKLKNQKYSKNDDDEKKPQSKSSSSSSSSSSSTEENVPSMTRKKTTGNRINKQGGMQIRELYEFLKDRGNLEFIIKQRQIQLLELIGEGGYGKVYKGKYMSCPVAVKDYIKTGKHQNQQDFLKELQILSGLKHPNIVLYMGICITTDKYQLVTQYLENGSLFDQVHKKKKQFTKNQILQIVDDIVKGMVYLHNMKNILHRDLKSSNVLLDQDWKVKLCDFGLSGHKKKSKKKNQGRIGTYQWMAPQVMKKQQMDFFSDVYSFGVILWELLTNKIPYEGYTQHQIIGEVGYDDNYKLKFDTAGSLWKDDDFIIQLMDECLNRVPDQRPTFIQIQSKLDSYFDLLEEQKGKRKSH